MKLWVILSLVVFSCADAASPSTNPTSKPAGQEIATILRLKRADSDFAGPLKAAVAEVNERNTISAATADALVRALVTGIDLQAFRAMTFDGVNAKLVFAENPGGMGTAGIRCRIAESLWARAKVFAERNNANAAQAFARASVLLAAGEDFQIGMATCTKIIRQPEFAQVSSLDEARVAALLQVVQIEEERARKFNLGSFRTANLLEAKWIKQPLQRREPADVARFRDAIKAAWNEAEQSDGARYDVIHLIWETWCVAQADGDRELAANLKALVDSLLTNEKDPIIIDG